MFGLLRLQMMGIGLAVCGVIVAGMWITKEIKEHNYRQAVIKDTKNLADCWKKCKGIVECQKCYKDVKKKK